MASNKPGRSYFELALQRIHAGEAGCIEWLGCKLPDGYAQTRDASRKNVYVHRLAYERVVGPIPAGLEIDHLCRNRACVNPAHLEPVTPRENVRRGTSFIADQMRKTTCPEGHPYDMVDNKGRRRCRVCKRSIARRSEARRRAVA